MLRLKFNMHPSLCLSFTVDIIPYQCGCCYSASIPHSPGANKRYFHQHMGIAWPGLKGWMTRDVKHFEARTGHCPRRSGKHRGLPLHHQLDATQKNLPITFSVEFKSCHWAICPLNATFCPCRWQADHCTIITFSLCNFDLRTGWQQSDFQW